jgi:hypothetical protein
MSKKTNQLFAIIALFSLISFSSVAQQAWTKEKGKFYAQVGGSALSYSQALNGKLKPSEWTALNATFSDITLQAYCEYGITDRLTVSAQLPFKVLSSSKIIAPNTLDEGSLAGFSNIQTALTLNLYNKEGITVSGKVNLGLPTAKFEIKTGLRTGFDAFSTEPSILVGFGHAKFFASGELGYAFRSNGYGNRIHAAAQIGKFLGARKKWLSILAFELQKTASNGTYNDATSTKTALYLSNQSYLSPTIKLGYKTNDKVTLWLSVGTGIAPITKNIAASLGPSLSVSYQN